MKLQYLGDSKDSFKWDYHHYLMVSLGYRHFVIAWMLTQDDGGSHGSTAAELYPANSRILKLCKQLKATRNPSLILQLPQLHKVSYQVRFHEPENNLLQQTTTSLLSNLKFESQQLLLIDPDNGFQPEKTCTDKHLRYDDLEQIVRAAPEDAVITVFQHQRRIKFETDFRRIRERIHGGHATAIYWRSVMFVCITKSKKILQQVIEVNKSYANQRQVYVLD